MTDVVQHKHDDPPSCRACGLRLRPMGGSVVNGVPSVHVVPFDGDPRTRTWKSRADAPRFFEDYLGNLMGANGDGVVCSHRCGYVLCMRLLRAFGATDLLAGVNVEVTKVEADVPSKRLPQIGSPEWNGRLEDLHRNVTAYHLFPSNFIPLFASSYQKNRCSLCARYRVTNGYGIRMCRECWSVHLPEHHRKILPVARERFIDTTERAWAFGALASTITPLKSRLSASYDSFVKNLEPFYGYRTDLHGTNAYEPTRPSASAFLWAEGRVTAMLATDGDLYPTLAVPNQTFGTDGAPQRWQLWRTRPIHEPWEPLSQYADVVARPQVSF